MQTSYIVKDSLTHLARSKSFDTKMTDDLVVSLEYPDTYPLEVPLFVKTSEELSSTAQSIIRRKNARVGESYCVRLTNGTLFSHSDIVTQDGFFLEDLSRVAARNHPRRDLKVEESGNQSMTIDYAEPTYVDESAGLLFFHAASGLNHSHWLIQTLVKLTMFEAAGIRPSKLIVQPSIKKYQIEMLSMLGYSKNDLIVRGVNQPMKFRELYVSYTSNTLIPDLSIFDRLIAETVSKDYSLEKIYVSRQDKSNIRRFLNEEKIIELVKEQGFEVVIPSKLTVEEEINIFRNAKVIVGPLGAGLYNSIFNDRKGTRVLALSDPFYMMEWATQIASLRQHETAFIFGNSFFSYTEGSYWGTHNNYLIDREVVRECLSLM